MVRMINGQDGWDDLFLRELKREVLARHKRITIVGLIVTAAFCFIIGYGLGQAVGFNEARVIFEARRK